MTSKLIYKGTAHGHTKTKDRVNITLKIHEETTDYPKLRYDTLEPVTTYKTVSLTGEIIPYKCRNAEESGQIDMMHKSSEFVEPNIKHIIQHWYDYHMNDVKAGTKAQTDSLTNQPYTSYDEACNILKETNLYNDNGYIYGTKWLLKVIPDDEIDYLKTLFIEDA